MDFIYDYISVNTFWTILFIVHALLAVALLGALSHQAMSVLMRTRQAAGPAGFVTRFTAVHGPSYATAVCVLWHAWQPALSGRGFAAATGAPLPLNE